MAYLLHPRTGEIYKITENSKIWRARLTEGYIKTFPPPGKPVIPIMMKDFAYPIRRPILDLESILRNCTTLTEYERAMIRSTVVVLTNQMSQLTGASSI